MVYNARSYHGPMSMEMKHHALRRQGYEMWFALTHTDWPWPDGLRDMEPLGMSGWEIRRRLKAWAKERGLDIKIHRDTGYHEDLHGSRVYEVWQRVSSNAGITGRKERSE